MIRTDNMLRIVSLFTGVGGIERGLEIAGHKTIMMCESEPTARAVLADRFPGIHIEPDVTTLSSLPECDILTAGWPCQDISLSGSLKGLRGGKSGLITEVFRLLAASSKKPKYVLLENVAFSLNLHKGESIRYVVSQLEQLGYSWAYRVLDTQFFGLPQRRRRLFVLGSLEVNPAPILLSGVNFGKVEAPHSPRMVGFYWTEGNRGIGWTPEAVPPLKGGSGLSIASPPAIWDRDTGNFLRPTITDAERLQGFEAGWTDAAEAMGAGRKRWMLIGNAVSVPVARWIGERLRMDTHTTDAVESCIIDAPNDKLARAAFGAPGTRHSQVAVQSEAPETPTTSLLSNFGLINPIPVSRRAIVGFTRRLEAAPLRKNNEFLFDLNSYIDRLSSSIA